MADCRFETLNEVEIDRQRYSKNAQKATKIEISFIFKFRIMVLEFVPKILYVVNFEICYRAQ